MELEDSLWPAEFLADHGDTASIPYIRAVMDSLGRDGPGGMSDVDATHWLQLRDALLRLEGAPQGDTRLATRRFPRLVRVLGEAEATGGWLEGVGPIDRRTAQKVVDLIDGAWPRRGRSYGGRAHRLVLYFADGVEFILKTPGGDSWYACDSTRFTRELTSFSSWRLSRLVASLAPPGWQDRDALGELISEYATDSGEEGD